MGERNGKDRVEVFPVAIGHYDHHDPLPVEPEVAALRGVLTDFGAFMVDWTTAMTDRGSDAVDLRLRRWAQPAEPQNTVLYWVGHGWSDGLDVSLAHARSPAAVRTAGVLPVHLAEALRSRQATSEESWAMVIVEACWSSRFVDKINALMSEGPVGADSLMLVGVSGDGATAIGRFSAALEACLNGNFRSNHRVELWRLVGELDRRLPNGLVIGRRLGDAALVRSAVPIASYVSVPLDVLHDLEVALSRLSHDERRHFLVKAQGAEEGEISWFFQGREAETATIADWLRAQPSGMLIVTGPAGSGKSALLGHVLVHSLTDLRVALIRSGLVEAISEDLVPDAFDDVVHLSGLSMHDFVARLAESAELGPPPSSQAGGGVGELAADITWIVDQLSRREHPLTLLIDALDEAQDPLALASSLLRPLSRLPRMRLIVGTRASTKESPDHPAGSDTNLLEALGADAQGDWPIITVGLDRQAVTQYIGKRLRIARVQSLLEDVDDRSLDEAAELVAARGRQFLYARLAVYELIAQPRLLDVARRADLERILDGDHRDLFRSALTRLEAKEPLFRPLLESLALARGRGLPIRDGIWAIMATALHPVPGQQATDEDITQLLSHAQPYIAIDEQQKATVYRLAHRTFVEHFLADWQVGD